MSNLLRPKEIFIYGFTIFAMFFGSGNLVFPLEIGQNAGNSWFLGFLGLFLSGIILPFIGLYVIKLYKGNYNKFFAESGKLASFALPMFTLSLLGAFGVVPRCITVAHGGIEYIFPQVPLTIFSLIFCIVCFIVCIKDRFMVSVLGKWMTPLLLAALIILISLGVMYAPAIIDNNISNNIAHGSKAFTGGFFIGYQTMDLFAAFFFSSLIFQQIQERVSKHATDKQVIISALKPSFIGAGLLTIIYFGFVFLGAHYEQITKGVSPELILPTIATAVMNEKATLIIGIIMVFSCLTTAVALNNIYARYLCTLFKVKNNKFPLMLFGTTAVSFLISLLDFRGIAAFLAPCLEVSYPSIILLTILCIFVKGHKKLKIALFYGVLAAMLIQRYL